MRIVFLSLAGAHSSNEAVYHGLELGRELIEYQGVFRTERWVWVRRRGWAIPSKGGKGESWRTREGGSVGYMERISSRRRRRWDEGKRPSPPMAQAIGTGCSGYAPEQDRPEWQRGGALEKQAPQWVLRRRQKTGSTLAPKRFSVDSTAGPALCARNIDLTRGTSGLDFLFPQSSQDNQTMTG